MAIITVSEPTAGSPAHYTLSNPATLETIGGFDATSPAQVNSAIEAARNAQPAWATNDGYTLALPILKAQEVAKRKIVALR